MVLPPRPQCARDPTEAITVVVAEDHVLVRELVVEYMKKHPAFIVPGVAGDGLEALKLCAQIHPRVLILDMRLPVLGGLEVLMQIRRESPDTQVLVFTAHADPRVLRQAVEAGARGIIAKQSPLELLPTAVKSVAAKEAFFCPITIQVLHEAMTQGVGDGEVLTLTPRERQVLKLVADGGSNKDVAAQLGISLKTTENHRHHLMEKLGTHNAADLTRAAYRLGLLMTGTASLGG